MIRKADLQTLIGQRALAAAVVLTALLAGCGGGERSTRRSDYGPTTPEPIPADIAAIPDAKWREEPLSKYGNPRSYRVSGETYYVERARKPYTAKGQASWYGKDFHGERTSSGEPYDMYKMTAAHKTLPIPSYVRVTNLQNGRQVILRVNDRGPFIDGRIIDVSYTAAIKLGMVRRGTAYVEVEALLAPPSPQVARVNLPPPEEPEPIQVASVATPAPVADSEGWISAPEAPDEAEAARPAETPSNESAPRVQSSLLGLFLQAGAFRSRGNAEMLQDKLSGAGLRGPIQLIAGTDELFRIRLGPYGDDETLVSDRLALETFGLKPSLIRLQ